MDKVNVVIVGSGAAGSLLAAKLSQAGKSVVILEAGPEHKLSDLISSQIWARRLKWNGPNTETTGTDHLSPHFNQGWGTGGAALHHYACWFRLHEEDFVVKSRFGKGLDWPISYQDLRPFYDQVQKEVGISGDAKKEVWRPPGDPYPMPPLSVFAQGDILNRGFQKMGLRTAPLPMAINSTLYNGNPACIYDGWCDAGCPTKALANPLVIYLPQALKAGAIIKHNCCVTRVIENEKGDRITSVEYFDGQGKRQNQPADLVILAAFALQNPRILLNSASSKHPNGLSNSNGFVGKYFMAHAATNIFGMFEEDTQNYLGTTGGQLLSQENYAKDAKKGYVGSYQWLIANALKPNDLLGVVNSRPEIFGSALHGFVKEASQHLATMTLVGENLPIAENRMILSEKKDKFGIPLASISHDLDPDGLKCFEAGVRQGTEIVKAAGAKDVWPGPRFAMHVMGGTIMGKSAEESVTNSYGQSHEIANLFLAGSGLFPTGGGVNPTFTIHALALRSARYILDQWNTIEK
jgi:choline dehydrogenase-like flavoprotein